MVAARPERRLAAILIADVVGYSTLMERDEDGTIARLKAHRKNFIEPLIAEYQGRIVKLMGDGALVEFASVVDAVRCAALIQRGMVERDAAIHEADRIRFRIGVNLGDVIHEADGDIYGDGVNVAARLEQLAEPGGVMISGTAYDHLQGKLDLPLEFAGEQRVKNIERLVRAYRVRLDGTPVPFDRRRIRRAALPALATLALFSLVAAAATWLPAWWTAKQPSNPSMPSVGATPPVLDKHRLAVLPFTNISADPRDEWFADGVTEETISWLSKIPELRVIARTSTVSYKGSAKSIAEIADELGAGTILEGSVRRVGDEVRITTQLIDSSSQAHLWAESYDRPMHEIFDVQSDVAQQVAKALQITLLKGVKQRVERAATNDSVAHDLYLKARRDHYKYTAQGFAQAITGYEAATSRDPAYAMAYVGLAQVWVDALGIMPVSSREAVARSIAAAERALAMDADLAEAHAALGYARFFSWDWPGTEASFKRALELNPNLAVALDGYNWGYLTQIRGQYDTALAGEQRAAEIDPLNSAIVGDVGFILYHAGRQEAAIETLKRVAEMAPDYVWSYLGLGAAHLALRRYDESVRWHEKAVEVSGGDSVAKARLGWAYGSAGRTKEATAILEELKSRYPREKFPPTNFVFVYQGLGDMDNAFLWLERAYQDHDFQLAFLQGREFEQLRGDSRYAAMQAKLNFPPRP
ncbi:adenylate/guanylate cyclase domain-containing protein [Rhizobium mongolense]|uniref:adenylate/guanylate cyclase domain-containing protein n=1 Tax=Rhizobium mongolense TaxID=57676 RepID=UPI0034A29A79